MKSKVAPIETPDPQRESSLKDPWPDFLFYSSAMAPVGSPKKYVERFMTRGQNAPTAPAHTSSVLARHRTVLKPSTATKQGPGRQATGVKKVIPDEATRAAALKRGESTSPIRLR